MKYLLFSLLLSTSLSATLANCDTYKQLFLLSADTFTETNSCQSQATSISAFKQLVVNHCPVDTDDITIVYYLHQHPCTNETL